MGRSNDLFWTQVCVITIVDNLRETNFGLVKMVNPIGGLGVVGHIGTTFAEFSGSSKYFWGSLGLCIDFRKPIDKEIDIPAP